MKSITINDILTPEEINRAVELYKRHKGTGQFANIVMAKLILPNMPRINKKIGQENDAKYLAYAVEYVLMQSEQP